MISPCIHICSLDTDTGYCIGCGRTGTEIGSWTTYSDAERDKLMSLLPSRLAALADERTSHSAPAIIPTEPLAS